MAAHAGEKAQKTGDFYCAHCSEKVHVKEGEKIPPCPNGHKTYETRRHEPGNKS
jgi:competence CoiA-like predicted nuclease